MDNMRHGKLPHFQPLNVAMFVSPKKTKQRHVAIFLHASAAAVATAFLPPSLLSLLDSAPALARAGKQALLPPIPNFGSNPYAQAAITKTDSFTRL